MQLTSYTDYSFRTLLYLASRQDRLVTISEISEFHGISRNHLVKVVHNLSTHHYIETVRGKSGGMRLNVAAEDISLAKVVEITEPNMNLLECFSESNTCALNGYCKLKGVLFRAKKNFMKELEVTTLADIL
ncbi:MAG: Rrf2 family transcriptional regulator [Mariprofundaceae bacterium]|nr:Rrf2 family transcriptional regulator [Mariprofundaceae bacterium]